MMNFINSILLGSIFEIFFISMMLIRIKELKSKRLLLFIGIFIIYFIGGFIVNFTYNNQYLFYILFNILTYILLKFLYKKKTQIIDIFLIYYIEMILNFSCLFSMKLFDYNYTSYYFSRFILTILMIIAPLFRNTYKSYIKYWNRKDGNKIKSITVRNLSIITMNVLLYIINWYVANYLIVTVNS